MCFKTNVMCPARTSQTEEEIVTQCRDNFYLVATVQGRLAYLLMSIHAVNPYLLGRITDYDPSHILLCNMLYGMAVHLFSRPSMTLISFLHRLSFSVLGSMMFNYSALLAYDWLKRRFEHRLVLLTILGFFTGRIMIVHLLAYLYHVDSRCIGVAHFIRRDTAYESMYV